jgi:cysteine desulfuration protein SufE
MSAPVSKLDKIVAEFADLEPRERLELLLEFAEKLPPLPQRYQAERDAGMHRIVECQTPTFIWVEIVDGHVQIHADAAPEAPTVKGFVGILVDAFNGATPETVLATQPDLLHRLGLLESLGMVRMRGLAAIQHYIRKQVIQAAALNEESNS